MDYYVLRDHLGKAIVHWVIKLSETMRQTFSQMIAMY